MNENKRGLGQLDTNSLYDKHKDKKMYNELENETNIIPTSILVENNNSELIELPINVEYDNFNELENINRTNSIENDIELENTTILIENNNSELIEIPIKVEYNDPNELEDTIQYNEPTELEDTIQFKAIENDLEPETISANIEPANSEETPNNIDETTGIDNEKVFENIEEENKTESVENQPLPENNMVLEEEKTTIEEPKQIPQTQHITIEAPKEPVVQQANDKRITKSTGYYIDYKVRLIAHIIIFIILLLVTNIAIQGTFDMASGTKINYEEHSNLDYKVFLKTNEFYDEEYLEKDKIYVASLIDKIVLNFQYNFSIEKESNIDFDYDIVAKLTINDDTVEKNYFEKDYVLKSTQKESIKNSKDLNLTEQVEIDYKYYNNLANNFKQQYGIEASSNLIVYLKVNKHNEDEELISTPENSTMYLKIPLSQKSIDIELNYKDINNSSYIIKANEMIIDNIIFGIISIIIIIITIFVGIKLIRLLAMLKTKKTNYDKYIEKILNEYDRFIVETQTGPDLKDNNVIKISSFEELLDLRENIKLPIMYYVITNHIKSYFYIKHNNDLYLLTIKAIDLEEKNNKN